MGLRSLCVWGVGVLQSLGFRGKDVELDCCCMLFSDRSSRSGSPQCSAAPALLIWGPQSLE